MTQVHRVRSSRMVQKLVRSRTNGCDDGSVFLRSGKKDGQLVAGILTFHLLCRSISTDKCVANIVRVKNLVLRKLSRLATTVPAQDSP